MTNLSAHYKHNIGILIYRGVYEVNGSVASVAKCKIFKYDCMKIGSNAL